MRASQPARDESSGQVWVLVWVGLMVLAGCSTESSDDTMSDMTSLPTHSGSKAKGDAEIELVIATAKQAPSGLEGGIRASVEDVDGCLGAESNGQRGVLYLPFGTESIAGGARLSDGTEFVLEATDVFVGGMWVGATDPEFPDLEQPCIGEAVVYVFTP